jgi:hypothetical protein
MENEREWSRRAHSDLKQSPWNQKRAGGLDAMELTVLGASGAWPAPGGAANGFLVRNSGYSLVLDFGMAVLPNLQRYLPHEQVDAIFISHELGSLPRPVSAIPRTLFPG